MEKEYIITVDKDGKIRYVYDDNLASLLDIGDTDISRASNVYPVKNDSSYDWFADMSLSDGPVLGPFSSRKIAIQEEIKWLQKI